MKDYLNVLPDKVKLLNKHFTKGRAGRKIRYITRHHTAGVLTTEQVWQVWQNRAASAHYIVEQNGTVGQLVWDANTAWSNGNQRSNQESITIEHSNSAGASSDWPISDATIIGGARLAAALCRFYKLGRPQFGVNIRDHREFSQTSCPHHLANGNKYHQQWMDEAQRFYDELTTGKTATPATTATSEGEDDMPNEKLDTLIAISRSNAALLKSIDNQLRGPEQSDRAESDRNPKGGRGWKQLGTNKDGLWLTVVDAIAALRQDVAALMKERNDG